jgi:hypothetical protein
MVVLGEVLFLMNEGPLYSVDKHVAPNLERTLQVYALVFINQRFPPFQNAFRYRKEDSTPPPLPPRLVKVPRSRHGSKQLRGTQGYPAHKKTQTPKILP